MESPAEALFEGAVKNDGHVTPCIYNTQSLTTTTSPGREPMDVGRER